MINDKYKKLYSFEDAPVWQSSIDLAVEIYEVTATFPKSEIYSITSQLRRAVSSISANLAEGFGRNGTKEKIQFYSIAYGSLLEVKSFLYLSERLGFIKETEDIMLKIISIQKQINSIKSSIKNGKD